LWDWFPVRTSHTWTELLTCCFSLVPACDAERPKAEDVFFKGRSREVKTLTSILTLMVQSGEQACLQAYIASRKHAVSTMMQLVATSSPATVPTAAHTERRIHECVSSSVHSFSLACPVLTPG
jgi:hypothetical protein